MHPLLTRQLKKAGLSELVSRPESEMWLGLLGRVSQSYAEADQERYLLERSLNISSREKQELSGNLRAERDRQSAILRSLGDGLCELDPEGRVLFINPQGELRPRILESRGEYPPDLEDYRIGDEQRRPISTGGCPETPDKSTLGFVVDHQQSHQYVRVERNHSSSDPTMSWYDPLAGLPGSISSIDRRRPSGDFTRPMSLSNGRFCGTRVTDPSSFSAKHTTSPGCRFNRSLTALGIVI